MKKLNKLQIKRERIISNDELRKLNGGYDGEGCTCLCIPGGYLPSATRDCGPDVIMHLEQQRGIVLINCKEHKHSGSSYLKGWLG